MNLLALHQALAAVCPIAGVSIGRAADKSTWRLDFAEEASDAQKEAAQSVVATFDPGTAYNLPPVTKLSLVDKLSDAELGTFIALRAGSAQTAAPLAPAEQVRLALRWDNASEIDPGAADVRAAFAAVFGPARMAELLGG